jgi:hypothetical protein
MLPETGCDQPEGQSPRHRLSFAAHRIWHNRIIWAAVTTSITFMLGLAVHYSAKGLGERLGVPEWLMLLLCPVGGLILSVLFSFLLNYLQAPSRMMKEQVETVERLKNHLTQILESETKWIESPEGQEWQKEQERKRRQRSKVKFQ